MYKRRFLVFLLLCLQMRRCRSSVKIRGTIKTKTGTFNVAPCSRHKFVIITTVNVYYLFSKANYSFKDYGHACTCGDISKKEQVS